MSLLKILTLLVFLGFSNLVFAVDTKPRFQHVMVIVLENSDYGKSMAQPFLSEFAKKGASLDNMVALTHPSEGNYISMIAGDTFGITNDKNIDLPNKQIADLLEAKGLTWKAYVEDYPGNCFLGEVSGLYARKHVPFLSFKDISTDAMRCKNIVNAKQLDLDINSQSLPNYSIYIPNLQNDGHNTNVTFADAYLNKKMTPLLQNSNFMKDMMVIITFDESESRKNNNQIYTAAFGEMIISGTSSNTAYNHCSILKTIESEWGLGSLGTQDKTAVVIKDIFK